MNRLSRIGALLSIPILFFLAGCSNDPGPSLTYTETIAEGRTAVKEVMAETGATALSVALTDGDRVVWSETFGVIDKITEEKAAPETMFGIGSVSKMFATVATMILVDQGKVLLDEPVVSYIKDFSMPLSPDHKYITVRMLLNHSSGFPGTDYRNSQTVAPYSGYAAQVMEGLKQQRLKHEPGYMSVYCNDGFTMIENLVKAVTNKSYTEFVQQEILTPLEMKNSRYATDILSKGSYARTHTGETPNSYTSFNVYASGGFYSTASDMAHLAVMLMNGGKYGSKQLLSANSIAAMAQDQTLLSFYPLSVNQMRFGLGWDSVVQAGLSAVGIKGWLKGGDISGYGSTLVVAPNERLAVSVIGASNGFGSSSAEKIAEKILLRALVERGRLATMPVQLDKSKQLPVVLPAPEEVALYRGYYAGTQLQFQVTLGDDGTLALALNPGGTWSPMGQEVLKLRSDGWYAADSDSVKAIRFLTRAGRRYLALRQVAGAGHYYSESLLGQRLEDKQGQPLSAAWQARLGEQWLIVNDDLYSASPELNTNTDPRLPLTTLNELPGYLIADGNIMSEMSPQNNDRLDGMLFLIPQIMGRDLMDLAVYNQNPAWLCLGSNLYRPLSGLTHVAADQSAVQIGNDGFAEWRTLPASGSISINGATTWKLFNASFELIKSGNGNGSAKFSGSINNYLMLYGTRGTTITLNLASP